MGASTVVVITILQLRMIKVNEIASLSPEQAVGFCMGVGGLWGCLLLCYTENRV
jgi:hypothetical protein